MSRFVKTIILAAIIVGGLWALVNRDQLAEPGKVSTGLGSQVKSVIRSTFAGWVNDGSPMEGREGQIGAIREPVIRIASFRLNDFGAKSEDRELLPLLVEICRRYDVIALQNLHSNDDKWLDQLAERLQEVRSNADYAFVTDLNENPGNESQNAILFNRYTVELEEMKWYMVNDPNQWLHRRPLVGWFRTQVQERDRALTFTLANVELTGSATVSNFGDETGGDLSDDRNEARLLGELFRAIRNDGRNEDDIILAGNFSRSGLQIGSGFQKSALTWAVIDSPTDVRQTRPFDNIVFYRNATVEHTGRGGVFDFMRVFNLRLAEAEALSHHLPVWAEFSVFEGGSQPSDLPRSADASR